QKQQIAWTRRRSQVFGEISSVVQYLALVRFPIQRSDIGVLIVPAVGVGGKQHRVPAGDQVRSPLRDFLVRLVQRKERAGGSARGGNQSHRAANAEDGRDIAVFAPACSHYDIQRENIHRRAAMQIDLPQSIARKKAEPLAVRREKWLGCAFRSCDWG